MLIVTEELIFVILDKDDVACTVEDKSFKVLDKCGLIIYNKNVTMFDVKRR